MIPKRDLTALQASLVEWNKATGSGKLLILLKRVIAVPIFLAGVYGWRLLVGR